MQTKKHNIIALLLCSPTLRKYKEKQTSNYKTKRNKIVTKRNKKEIKL